jgi:flagellar biogenesis protein FliO
MWSWLQAKYTVTATKRLRISETVSLGEKRFVAIVKVEDREFLIGGGTAGMSLLAQLGSVSEPEEKSLRQPGVERGAK